MSIPGLCYAKNNWDGVWCGGCPVCAEMRKVFVSVGGEPFWDATVKNQFKNHVIHRSKIKDMKDEVYFDLKGIKKHMFITISLPKKMYDYKALPELISNFQNDYMEGSYFCIEFAGKEMQFHPHIHMIIPRLVDRTRLIRDLSTKFNIGKNFVDIGIRDHSLYSTRLDYIKGNKCQNKMEQVEEDKCQRKIYDLSNFYSFDILNGKKEIGV